jgi:hypothetical protein
MNRKKTLDVGEYLVAIKTGINYWHILSGNKIMITLKEAEDYADNFSQFQAAILKVESVTPKANECTT